jgi:molybdopterin synthase catalytic subunit
MFAISDQTIDVAAMIGTDVSPRAGAVAMFEGRVRNHHDGRAVHRLEYECYPAMASSEGQAVLSEALARFDIIASRCVHRVGDLGIGDVAIVVHVTAAHRAAAIHACEFIVDQVKARVPIWKKEHYDGGEATWVNCPSENRATTEGPA